MTVLRRVFPIANTTRAGAELTITMPVQDDELSMAGLVDRLVA